MLKEKLHTESLRVYPWRINWEITQQCNFHCSYCSNSETVNKTAPPRTYTPEEFRRFFDQTGVSWLILITGGEPFLYPDFVKICQELTGKHDLQITTNLSLPAVDDFIETIPAERIFNISASYHHEERKDPARQAAFISRCHRMLDKGFNLIVNLIAYPPLMDSIESDIRMFEKEGIDTMLFGYRGFYGGKHYPYDYNDEELELIRKYAIDDTEIKIATNRLNYYGYYCEAGSRYFSMDQDGNVGRCFTLPKRMGNLFSGVIALNEKITPCIAAQCTDCYNGPASVTGRKANGFRILLEKHRYQKRQP